MARGIDDIDTMIFKLRIHSFPKAGCGGGGNGDTTLLFLLHPVHGGGTIMHFTNFMRHTCVEQHALCSGGFACIYMCADAYVAIATDGSLTCHNNFLVLKAKKGGY
jgi:hypothetical protein